LVIKRTLFQRGQPKLIPGLLGILLGLLASLPGFGLFGDWKGSDFKLPGGFYWVGNPGFGNWGGIRKVGLGGRFY